MNARHSGGNDVAICAAIGRCIRHVTRQGRLPRHGAAAPLDIASRRRDGAEHLIKRHRPIRGEHKHTTPVTVTGVARLIRWQVSSAIRSTAWAPLGSSEATRTTL
jgi:hypothetical protein